MFVWGLTGDDSTTDFTNAADRFNNKNLSGHWEGCALETGRKIGEHLQLLWKFNVWAKLELVKAKKRKLNGKYTNWRMQLFSPIVLLFHSTTGLQNIPIVEMTSVQIWSLQFDVTAPSADAPPPSGIHKELEVLGKTQNGCLANLPYDFNYLQFYALYDFNYLQFYALRF